MSEMVERVAEALKVALEKSDDGAYIMDIGKITVIDGTFDMKAVARAAIAELRKPTQSMLDAFAGMAMPIGYTQEGWEAAIDEALKP